MSDALRAAEVVVACLREAGDDVDAGLAAAEYILSTDVQGHEHRGKGPGGGEFTSKGTGGQGSGAQSQSNKGPIPQVQIVAPVKSRATVILENAAKIRMATSRVGLKTNEWFIDEYGDGVLVFKTESGRKYKVMAVHRQVDKQAGEHDIPEMIFTDSSNSTKITGRGEALQVFSKAIPAVVAYAQKRDLDAVTLSAEEPSRQVLYDRLVRTVASVMPGYFAVSADDKKGVRHYMVGKAAMKDSLIGEVTKKYTENMQSLVEGVS